MVDDRKLWLHRKYVEFWRELHVSAQPGSRKVLRERLNVESGQQIRYIQSLQCHLFLTTISKFLGWLTLDSFVHSRVWISFKMGDTYFISSFLLSAFLKPGSTSSSCYWWTLLAMQYGLVLRDPSASILTSNFNMESSLLICMVVGGPSTWNFSTEPNFGTRNSTYTTRIGCASSDSVGLRLMLGIWKLVCMKVMSQVSN